MASSKRLALFLPDMTGGGAERVALRLMEDFLAKGYKVDLVLMRRFGDLLQILPPGVNVIDLRAPKIRQSISAFRRYLVEVQPDAVQVSMWPLTAAAIIAHRLARSRARIVVSDHAMLSRQYGHLGGAARALMKWSIRHLYPLADARIIVSHRSADDLAALSGLDRASLEIIHNPVRSPPAAETDPAVEQLWGDGNVRILTVGNLKPEKRHDILISAFARLKESRKARLIIVGEGPERARLEDLIRERGLQQDVVLAGFTLDPWPYYRSADLFVLSSDHEGFGLVVIEAMQCGLRIVSTDCEGGPSEILQGGRLGELVPAGNDAALAKAMLQQLDVEPDAELLRLRAEQLSGQACSNRYLELMLGSATS